MSRVQTAKSVSKFLYLCAALALIGGFLYIIAGGFISTTARLTPFLSYGVPVFGVCMLYHGLLGTVLPAVRAGKGGGIVLLTNFFMAQTSTCCLLGFFVFGMLLDREDLRVRAEAEWSRFSDSQKADWGSEQEYYNSAVDHVEMLSGMAGAGSLVMQTYAATVFYLRRLSKAPKTAQDRLDIARGAEDVEMGRRGSLSGYHGAKSFTSAGRASLHDVDVGGLGVGGGLDLAAAYDRDDLRGAGSQSARDARPVVDALSDLSDDSEMSGESSDRHVTFAPTPERNQERTPLKSSYDEDSDTFSPRRAAPLRGNARRQRPMKDLGSDITVNRGSIWISEEALSARQARLSARRARKKASESTADSARKQVRSETFTDRIPRRGKKDANSTRFALQDRIRAGLREKEAQERRIVHQLREERRKKRHQKRSNDSGHREQAHAADVAPSFRDSERVTTGRNSSRQSSAVPSVRQSFPSDDDFDEKFAPATPRDDVPARSSSSMPGTLNQTPSTHAPTGPDVVSEFHEAMNTAALHATTGSGLYATPKLTSKVPPLHFSSLRNLGFPRPKPRTSSSRHSSGLPPMTNPSTVYGDLANRLGDDADDGVDLITDEV